MYLVLFFTLFAGEVCPEGSVEEIELFGPPVPQWFLEEAGRPIAGETGFFASYAATARPEEGIARHRIVTLSPGGPLLDSPILSRVEYYQGLRNFAIGNHAAARENLEAALAGDPSIVRAHILLSLVHLRELNPRWVITLTDGFRALGGNFRSQSLLLANSLILFFLFVILALHVVMATILLRALPGFRHAVMERIPGNLPRLVRELYPVLIVFSAFILFRPWHWPGGLGWIMICGALVVWRSLARWEKWGAGSYIASLALIPLLLKLAVGASMPALPGSALFALSGGPIAPLDREGPEAILASSPGDNDMLFSLALLERERGHKEKALHYYREILASGHESPEVLNNMGNLHFLLGSPEKAIEYYDRAIDLTDKSAASHYNLGQVHLDAFEFDLARLEFTEAAEIDFMLIRTLSGISRRVESTTLVDETLPVSHIWYRFLRGEPGKDALLWSEAFGAARRIVFPVSSWGAIPLAALLAGAIWFGRTSPRLGKCFRCGMSICRRCRVRENKADLCRTCSGLSVEQRWSTRTLQYHRPVSLSLGMLMPGAAHLYLGRYWRGAIFISLAIATLLGWACRGAVLKPFPIISPAALEPLENLVFGWIFFPFYIWVLVDSLRIIRMHFRSTEKGARK